MTIRTLHSGVRSRQRERCLAVIEVGGCPRGGAVTDFAGLRESRCYVIRIGRAVEIRKMARITERTKTSVFAAGVASQARLAYVSPG